MAEPWQGRGKRPQRGILGQVGIRIKAIEPPVVAHFGIRATFQADPKLDRPSPKPKTEPGPMRPMPKAAPESPSSCLSSPNRSERSLFKRERGPTFAPAPSRSTDSERAFVGRWAFGKVRVSFGEVPKPTKTPAPKFFLGFLSSSWGKPQCR